MNKKLKQDINFFDYIGKDKSASVFDFTASIKKCLIVFVGITVVVLGIMFAVQSAGSMKINGLKKDIEAMAEQLKEIDVLKEQAEALQRDIDKFKSSLNEFDTMPRLTSGDIEKIARCKPLGLSITSFSYSGNSISINCTGTTETMTADFAYNLRNSESKNEKGIQDGNLYNKDFKNVQYSGASGSNGVYTSTIVVELNDIVVENAEETTEAGGAVSE